MKIAVCPVCGLHPVCEPNPDRNADETSVLYCPSLTCGIGSHKVAGSDIERMVAEWNAYATNPTVEQLAEICERRILRRGNDMTDEDKGVLHSLKYEAEVKKVFFEQREKRMKSVRARLLKAAFGKAGFAKPNLVPLRVKDTSLGTIVEIGEPDGGKPAENKD